MKHWTERYIGRPYSSQNDCAQLAFDVRCDVFNQIPEELLNLNRAVGQVDKAKQMEYTVHALGIKTDKPQEGDAVLMLVRSRPSHIGIYFERNGIPYVLHAMKNAGQAVVHKICDLPKFMLQVEGYYKWPIC